MEGCILGSGKVGSKTGGEFLRGKMECKELAFGVMGRKLDGLIECYLLL